MEQLDSALIAIPLGLIRADEYESKTVRPYDSL
jgi:hypothetical protein